MLTVPAPLGDTWLYPVERVAYFSPEVLKSLAAILEWWPAGDGITLKAVDGTASYSLSDPVPDDHRVRRGCLVYQE